MKMIVSPLASVAEVNKDLWEAACQPHYQITINRLSYPQYFLYMDIKYFTTTINVYEFIFLETC